MSDTKFWLVLAWAHILLIKSELVGVSTPYGAVLVLVGGVLAIWTLIDGVASLWNLFKGRK